MAKNSVEERLRRQARLSLSVLALMFGVIPAGSLFLTLHVGLTLRRLRPTIHSTVLLTAPGDVDPCGHHSPFDALLPLNFDLKRSMVHLVFRMTRASSLNTETNTRFNRLPQLLECAR